MTTDQSDVVTALLGARTGGAGGGGREAMIKMLLDQQQPDTGESGRDDRHRRRSRWLARRNARLAEALGACPCWGANRRCPHCAGRGTSGWQEPDPELFIRLVEPALHRLGLLHDDPEATTEGKTNE